MAVFKATENKKKSSTGTFKATQRKSYDSAMVYEWETSNKNALNTINSYYDRLNKNEWLSADDLKAFRSALDTYTSTTSSLRGLSKSFGDGFSEEDEKNWQDSIASMNSAYEGVSKLHSAFKDAESYTSWHKKETFIDAYLKDAEKAKAEFEYEDYWLKEADRRKEEHAVKNSDDFEEYFKAGREKGVDTEFKWATTQNGVLELFSDVHNDMIIAYREKPELFFEKSGNLASGGATYASEAYNYAKFMSDDEYAVYTYYYGKDKGLAEAYLKSLEDTLNQRHAGMIAENVSGNGFLEATFAVAAGLDQWVSGIKNLDNFFTGSDPDDPSAMQYASGIVRENLADDGFKLPDWMGGSSLGQVGYDLLNTIGNQLPNIALSYLPVVGQALSLTSMGLSSAGNAYAEAINNKGMTAGQAQNYAALVGASEASLQYFLGGFSSMAKGGGEGLFQTFAGTLLNHVDNAFARVAIQLGGSMLDEGLEESLQTLIEPVFEAWVTGEKYNAPDASEVLYSGLLGALSAGMLEGGGTIAGEVNTYKAGKAVQNVGAVDRLTKLGKTFSADSVAYKLAGKIDENTGAYTIGRLLNEVGATLTEQNQAEIIKSLTRKGVLEKDAKVLAKYLEAVVEGNPLTEKQAKILEYNNDVLAKTVQDVIVNQNSTVNQRMQGYAETMGMIKSGGKATAKTAQIGTVASETGVSSVEDETAEIGGTDEVVEGKTTLIGTGEEVKVKEISSIRDGEVSVWLEDGREASVKDIDFGDKNEGLIYEAVANMNPETARDLIGGFNQGNLGDGNTISLENYLRGFNEAYTYGLYGMPSTEMSKNGFSADLSDVQRRIAYNRGKTDSITKVKSEQASVDAKKEGAKNAQSTKKTVKAYNGETHINDTKTEGMTARQKESVKALKVIADAFGLNIYFFESPVVDGKRVGKNGYYNSSDKSIHLDLYAGQNGRQTILFTAAHELTHLIKDLSPAKFKVFADFLFEQYGKKGVSVEELIQAQIAKAKKNGRDISYETAYEEVVADACETMLADGNAIEKIAKLKAKDKTLWEKIKDFIKKLVDKIKAVYAGLNPDSMEAKYVREMVDVAEQLQALWTDALVDAGEAYSAISETLSNNGIMVDTKTESASLYSVRDLLDSKQQQKVAKALAERFDVTVEEAKNWISAETSLASLILNPKYSQYLDYTADPNEVAIKQNADYPQGTVDFSPICAKRREFTSVMNNILRLFPNHVFAATDLAKIRTIMQEEGMTIPCGICYVEDRRQLDTIVAQNFIDSLKLYRDGSKTRPDGKPFNTNQLKGLKLIDGDSYTPSVYELVSLEGLNVLKEKNPNMAEAWVKFNNARGMQSVRLLANEAEYKRQILKYSKSTVKSKNDKGGLRVYSFSDAEMFHLIDIIQVITDSATVGLSLQGYTKVNEYARAVKDTGEKLNRSLIPKGELGYHLEDGKVVLDYDTVEGIDINHPDFFDNRNNPNVGNITIGVSDVQIRAAMVSDFVDQIIPFHTGQSEEVLGEKGISTWSNYKDFQTEKDIATGKVSDHQINIYTEVLQVLEEEGKPITKRTFVEKFLQVCRENNLTPRFSQFLNTNAKGEYIYTEGYHKMLVDFKTFAQTKVGEYLPQKPVKPIFDDKYITKILKDYVKDQKVKDAELAKSMPKVIERITNEIVKPSDTKLSDRETSWRDVDKIQGLEHYSVEEVTDIVRQHIENIAAEYGEEISIIDIRPYGSRARGTAKNSSDLDVVLQYEGDIREDDMFNMLNDEDKLVIDGIEVDINPIKADDTGTIEEYLDRVYSYDKYSETKYSDRDYENNEFIKSVNAVLEDIRVNGKWTKNYIKELYEKSPKYDFIQRIHDGDAEAIAELKALVATIDDATLLDNLLYYPVYARMPDYRKSHRKAINAYKKVINNRIAEAIKGKDIGFKARDYTLAEIRNLFNSLNSNSDIAKLADKVFGLSERLDLEIVGVKKLSGDTVGTSWRNQIEYLVPYLNNTTISDQVKATVLLHELIHACTTYAINAVNSENSPQYIDVYVSNGMKKAVNILNGIYDEIRLDKSFESYYGIKSVKEMVAELSNPKFREQLKKKSLWQMIVDAIKRIFGIETKTALDGVSTAVDYILDNFDAEAYNAHIGKPNASTDKAVRYSDRDLAPTFYSQMGKVVEGMKQDKFAANSVVSMLRGRGVKAEEIRWSGIVTFLEGKKSVTKQELLEFIAGSQLQIGEEILSNEEMPYSKEEQDLISKYEAERDIVADNLKSEWKRIVGSDIPITYFGAGLEQDVVSRLLAADTDKRGNTEDGYKYKAAKAALQRCIEYSDNYFGYDNERQAFREAVRNPQGFINSNELTSFEKGVFRDFIKAKEAYNKVEGIPMYEQKALIGIAASADRISSRILKVKSEHRAKQAKRMTKWGQYKLGGGTNYREILFKISGSNYYNDAMAAHWDERDGVLAHARIQDFKTASGKKMLFIEEIQSDWHNEGKKKGYADESVADYTLGEYHAQSNGYDIADVYDGNGNEVASVIKLKDSFHVDLRNGNYFGRFKTEKEVLSELKRRDNSDVPDAPFKDNYHEYVLKRLLRMAAEQGYDGIGWTPADIQSKRWSDEYAEGYRIEYDQDMPKFLKKYGRQWGAKVGYDYVRTTTVDASYYDEQIAEVENDIEQYRQQLDGGYNTEEYEAFCQEGISDLQNTLQVLYKQRQGEKIWSMELTDSMKDSVLHEGQVLYSDRDTSRNIGKELIEYKEGNAKPDLTLVKVYNERTGKTETTVKFVGDKPEGYIPKKIAYCYKLFEQHPDGTLHALFAGATNATPIGEWQYAKGFPNTDKGVKGMNLRERYGWHLSAGLPSAPHLMSSKDFGRGYPSKNAFGHPKGSKRVWVRMAYDATTDFNGIADSTTAGDIFGLIPFGGYYAFKENNQSEWVISSAVKIDKILTETERQQILQDAGYDEYEAWRKKHRPTEAEKAESKRRSTENKKAKDLAKKAGLNYLSESAKEMREAINSRIIENPELSGVKYSDRDPDSVSNRSLLANALESAVQNDIERNKLEQYKAKIDLINAEEQKLQRLTEEIKQLFFTKGTRNDERIRNLQFERKQTINRINTYDRQLLTLEASKPLKAVLEREKVMAYKRAEQKGKEALSAYREKAAKTQRELMTRYQESRAKATENRHKTELRHKIKDVVSKLNQLLTRPTKDKHVKEELRTAVAEALSVINMDTVGADERVAKYNALIAKTNDPDMIAELTRTRNRIELQGEALKDKLTALQTVYEKVKNSTDPELKNAYQEPVMNAIKNVVAMVGNTSIRDMSLSQLEAVYEMYSMVLHTVRTANKAFKAKKGETITQLSEAVNDEIRKVGKEKFKRNPFVAWLRKVGWTLLKPYTAFRTIGSNTFTGLFTELRNGEDVYYVDINEAKNFIHAQYEKHNFKKWDKKKTYTFTAKSGKTFTLTLEQVMSLYAYSRRNQAHDHIIEGGIVLEDSVIETKNKLGIPVKYNVDTKSAFNISEEVLDEICNSLTAEQKSFVENMQDYLSDVMGAKGNEVSMELLGVKLFKEKFYFPLKSSKYYMGFKPEEAGEIKLKNSSFSKETVQHANNPVVLQNFTDVWANHINDMSMYHAFVLPLEDFTRVYNYKTRTDEYVETMSTEATIANAYGEGATQYIRNFLKSLNGGVRIDGVDIADKMVSLTKKGAVLGSASVTIQQPSAIMRAMALINPIHFVTTAHKSINLIKHKRDWTELKTYAPIAGIKEMGGYDIGIGQGTVDWIKDQSTFKDKVDDALGKAPAFMDEITWVSIWNAVKRETASKNKGMDVNSEEFLKKAGERFTEVITFTQVYDSVFSRSDIMRNANPLAKMLTAFMAEPTTTLNMLIDSFIEGKRTGKVGGFVKATAGTTGAVVAAIVFNAALKSIITAMRDDDEDESYAEKYLGAFVGNTLDELNPLSYIPFVKDIVSIFNGYDVERMDMALFSDLKQAIDAFDSDSKSEYEKWSGLIGATAAFFGIPVKNVERDIRGAINTIMSFINGEKTTSMGIENAIKEAVTGKEISNVQQLYEAYLEDNEEQIKRVEGRFKDKSEIEAAIRKALRENDPRIREAAQAVIDGNHAERIRLTKEIVAEGHFRQDLVIGAINAELTYIRSKMKEEENG